MKFSQYHELVPTNKCSHNNIFQSTNFNNGYNIRKHHHRLITISCLLNFKHAIQSAMILDIPHGFMVTHLKQDLEIECSSKPLKI